MEDLRTITWKVFIEAPPHIVFKHLSIDHLRQRYWAEKSVSVEDGFELSFPNGEATRVVILEEIRDRLYSIDYFNSHVVFELKHHIEGTELKVTNTKIPDEAFEDVLAGWVSVLLTMKAAVQFSVDLRNHHPGRTWDHKFVDN